jgi:hypothetical protein
MIKFILKKYYPHIFISLGLLFISIVFVKNLYISTVLTVAVFVALPYYLVRSAFIAFNQNEEVTRNFAKDGFLGGGIVNLVMSIVGTVENVRELSMIILGSGNQSNLLDKQTYFNLVFMGAASTIIFPCLMFVIGGVCGWFASRPFRRHIQ